MKMGEVLMQKNFRSKPQLFPLNDDSYLKANNIGERATLSKGKRAIYEWTNEDGRVMFVTWRYDYVSKETGEPDKKYYPIERRDNEYCETGPSWKPYPLFKLHELITTTKPILVVEGVWTCESAQRLLPDYFVTAWCGGVSTWNLTNWEPLKDKKDITFWPDNDPNGDQAVANITRFLSDRFDVQAKIVVLSKELRLPKGWDLADLERKGIKEEIDIRALLRDAEKVTKHNYEDIETDILKNRWVFIKKSKTLYFDRFKKEFIPRDTINTLYLRDHNLKIQATRELNKQNVEVVDGTAFWPCNKEYLYQDGNSFINTYKQKTFEPLQTKVTKEQIKVFRNHLWVLSNEDEGIFNCFEDTIAHDLQFPEVNRMWALLLQGDEGVGKSVLFELITQLMGSNNVEWIPSYAFSHKFRDWLKKCCVIVCNEFCFDKYNSEGSSAYGMLREIITETKHFVESKGVDQYQHKGHYKLWLSSNDPTPIKLRRTDRRYVVVKIHKTKKMLLKKDPDYYKHVWAFVEDQQKLRQLFWYYKSVHQVSKAFCPRTPLETEAKKELIAESQSQVFRDLDVMFENKEGPFAFDIVNSTSIINYVREKETGYQGTPNPRPILIHKINQNKITDWITYREGVPIKKGDPVPITADELAQTPPKKRRYHAIRNQEHWIECESLDLIREHMKEEEEEKPKKEQIKLSVFPNQQSQPKLVADDIPF